MNTFSIFICGVGGQGVVLAGELLSEGALSAGYDVKMSEVHGMAQRGGTVVSTVRFGEKVYSPIIAEGQADVLLSFELLEAYRLLSYLRPDGKAVVNTQKIMPATVSAGIATYPDNIQGLIKEKVPDTVFVDAISLAKKAGTSRAVNVVMIGALSNFLPIKLDIWTDVIRKKVPEKFLDANLRAFQLGRETMGK